MNKKNLETELKFQLTIPTGQFLKKINQLGMEIQPRGQEMTAMYDNQEQFMLISDGRLRIRTGYKSYFSYKRPLTRNGIKVEIEYESEIDSPQQLELILKEIGYEKVTSYTRFRTIWQMKKVKVYLDEFSFGNYVEIEGKKREILKIAEELEFDINKNITQSYDGIYKEICKKRGLIPSPHIK